MAELSSSRAWLQASRGQGGVSTVGGFGLWLEGSAEVLVHESASESSLSAYTVAGKPEVDAISGGGVSGSFERMLRLASEMPNKPIVLTHTIVTGDQNVHADVGWIGWIGALDGVVQWGAIFVARPTTGTMGTGKIVSGQFTEYLPTGLAGRDAGNYKVYSMAADEDGFPITGDHPELSVGSRVARVSTIVEVNGPFPPTGSM